MDVQELQGFLKNLFSKAGFDAESASYCADCIIQTNLWGVDSHGVLRMPIYLKRVMEQVVNAQPDIKAVKDDQGPIALLDGDAGMGFVVGKKGMEIAVEKAKKFGISYVLIRNSNHFGAAALYAREAVEAGMIGIVSTNVIPNIGMKGNKKPSTGNNPIALAAPLDGPFPFALDISLSAVSGGKILLAAKKGEKIPTTWAVTKEGEETDDPEKGFAGFMLPVGMHKGFGLSLFVDIITGVLSGGPFLQGLKSMYKNPNDPSLNTHMFIAIDPTFFLSEEAYKERIGQWVSMIHDTPMVEGYGKQIIPGELEYHKEQERRLSGIPVPAELAKELVALAAQLQVEIPESLQ